MYIIDKTNLNESWIPVHKYSEFEVVSTLFKEVIVHKIHVNFEYVVEAFSVENNAHLNI